MDNITKDQLILALAERLYICSRLLTAAAERSEWDSPEVRDLVDQLRQSVRGCTNAGIKE